MLLTFLLVSGSAFGQQARTISFDEAVRLALDRNIDLQKAANTVELQSALVTRQRADFLPNLNVSTNPSQRFGLTFDQTAGQLVQESTQSMSANLSANVTLFNGFGNVAALRQAQHEFDVADLSYERAQQRVVFDVASRFLQTLLDRELIGIVEEALEAQRQQLARIQELTRVGARPISDLYQQQANVAASELELLNAERNHELSQIRLIQMLELDPFGDYLFVAPAVEEQALAPEAYQLETLITTALQNRRDLHTQQARIAAADQGLRLARASFWPTVTVGTGFGSSYSSLRRDMQTREPVPFGNQMFQQNRTGSLGFSISFPIFDRLQTRTNIERARVQYDNARLDLQGLQQEAALEVRQAYLDYLTDAKRMEVTQKQLEAAELAFQAEQERYNLGASTLVELTQAQASYMQAASNRAQAVYNFLFQSKVIDYYTGQTDPTAPLFE